MSSNNDDILIGRRLQAIRKEKGLSQQVFADSLSVSLRTYQNYERGDRPISKELICGLIEIYSVDPTWLLTGVDTQPSLTVGEINVELFNEVLSILKSDISEVRGLNALDFGHYAALIYNQVCSIADLQGRKNAIVNSVIMLSKAVMQTSLEHVESLPPEKVPGDVTELIKLHRDRIKELEFLMPKSEVQPSTDEEDSDVKHSVTQSIKGKGHQIAGRDVVNTGRKRKK